MMKKYRQFISENLDNENPNLGFEVEPSENPGVNMWLQLPEWKKNSVCYIFSLRPNNISPDSSDKLKWRIDTWFKVDYENVEEATSVIHQIRMRSRFNNSHVYGVWLPLELADEIDEDDNPEDYMSILMEYKFKIG